MRCPDLDLLQTMPCMRVCSASGRCGAQAVAVPRSRRRGAAPVCSTLRGVQLRRTRLERSAMRCVATVGWRPRGEHQSVSWCCGDIMVSKDVTPFFIVATILFLLLYKWQLLPWCTATTAVWCVGQVSPSSCVGSGISLLVWFLRAGWSSFDVFTSRCECRLKTSFHAKVLTGGGDLREAQVDVPLFVSHSCVWSQSWVQ